MFASLSFVVVYFPTGLGIFARSGLRRSEPPPLGALAWAPLAQVVIQKEHRRRQVAPRDLPRVALVDCWVIRANRAE